MRITPWLLVLAFVTFGCGPWHHRRACGMGMGMGCPAGACRYKSECFSDGAMRSNDGVCQACSGGKWVPGTGCREHGCHECGGKMGKSPCDHEEHHRKARH